MFKSFTCACDSETLSISDILSAAKANMLCYEGSAVDTSTDHMKVYLERNGRTHSNLFKEFQSWVGKLAEEDPNWKFWANFVFRDLLSYLSLYVSMRGGLWKLRMGGIKTLAPLFAAFDRPHYQKLLPNHLHDLATMPSEVISFFESGSFVCNVTGGHMHSVALDEAHEMLVNKDLKTTIVRPTKEYLDRMLYYYPVRSMIQKAVKREVLLSDGNTQGSKVCVFDRSPNSIRKEENVQCMMTKIDTSNSLALHASSGQPSRCLTAISGQEASPEQQVDLLGFWEVGSFRLDNQIKFFVLRHPSTQAPRRKATLLTFASTRKQTKKMKRLDKEKKIIGKCLRRAFAWNAKYGSSQQHVGQQYLELPRAISDPSGNPHKGQKSYTTKRLEKRYKDLICNQLPGGWVPDAVVVEGMFMINTSPLSTHSTAKDYTQFLLRRFVVSHFSKGCKEVHIVFDNPGRLPESPKSFERRRRDDAATLSSDHRHTAFSDACALPSNWRDCLNCRQCKRALVVYLGQSMKNHAVTTCKLRGQQNVVLAGCFAGVEQDQAWEVGVGGVQPVPQLNCEAEEADTSVAACTQKSRYQQTCLFS